MNPLKLQPEWCGVALTEDVSPYHLLRCDYIGASGVDSGVSGTLLTVDLYEQPADDADFEVRDFEDALLHLWFCPSRRGWRQAWRLARQGRRYWRLCGFTTGVIADLIDRGGVYPLVIARQVLIRYEGEV